MDASLRLAPLIRGFSSEEAQIHAAEIALVRGQEEKAARHAVRARSLAPRQKIGDRALQILRQVRPGWAGEAGAKLGEDGT